MSVTPDPCVPTVTPRCVGCGVCLLTCPEHAIRPDNGTPVSLVVLADSCTGCLECLEVCPVDAITTPAVGTP